MEDSDIDIIRMAEETKAEKTDYGLTDNKAANK
jgi:hypothetical protein